MCARGLVPRQSPFNFQSQIELTPAISITAENTLVQLAGSFLWILNVARLKLFPEGLVGKIGLPLCVHCGRTQEICSRMHSRIPPPEAAVFGVASVCVAT